MMGMFQINKIHSGLYIKMCLVYHNNEYLFSSIKNAIENIFSWLL